MGPAPAPQRPASQAASETTNSSSAASNDPLSPEQSAACSLHRMADLDRETTTGLLKRQGEAVASGDLDGVRRSLTAQVTTLERMFHHFFDLACQQEPGSESYGRLVGLSLRAQMQSARTAAVLARLSHAQPPGPLPAAAPEAQSPPQTSADTAWLPATCGPDCASHVALARLTQWATRSPASKASLTRIMGADAAAPSTASIGTGGPNAPLPQGA